MLRITHAICGTAMLVTATILHTVDEGGWGLIGLAGVGLIVLMSSYRPGRDTQSPPL